LCAGLSEPPAICRASAQVAQVFGTHRISRAERRRPRGPAVTDGEHGLRGMLPGAGDEGGGTQAFRWRATLG
jgi:hypothetical protein